MGMLNGHVVKYQTHWRERDGAKDEGSKRASAELRKTLALLAESFLCTSGVSVENRDSAISWVRRELNLTVGDAGHEYVVDESLLSRKVVARILTCLEKVTRKFIWQGVDSQAVSSKNKNTRFSSVTGNKWNESKTMVVECAFGKDLAELLGCKQLEKSFPTRFVDYAKELLTSVNRERNEKREKEGRKEVDVKYPYVRLNIATRLVELSAHGASAGRMRSRDWVLARMRQCEDFVESYKKRFRDLKLGEFAKDTDLAVGEARNLFADDGEGMALYALVRILQDNGRSADCLENLDNRDFLSLREGLVEDDYLGVMAQIGKKRMKSAILNFRDDKVKGIRVTESEVSSFKSVEMDMMGIYYRNVAVAFIQGQQFQALAPSQTYMENFKKSIDMTNFKKSFSPLLSSDRLTRIVNDIQKRRVSVRCELRKRTEDYEITLSARPKL